MKSNKYFYIVLFACLLWPAIESWGQSKNVSGVIYDAETHSTMAGAMVLEDGTNNIVITNKDGRYSIKVSGSEASLTFSLMGYESITMKVGVQSVIDVNLQVAATQLDEVVVTALGITREEKSLGYAVSKVDSEVINNTVSGNWLNSLSGKVAGLNFDGASSGPGGSMRVTLRGEGSLSHDNNEALFVIDGIPVSNPKTSSGGGSYTNTDAPVDYGNNIGDLNPEDIESVSVLKGPAATALYGSRAGNGAIVITTKKGRQNKGLGITVNSSVVFEKAGFWPDLQDEYGAGNGSYGAYNGIEQHYYSFWNITNPKQTTDGGTTPGRRQSRYAFGPRYEGQLFYQHNGYDWDTELWTATPWVAKNWYKGYFETGVTFSNSISLDGNDGKGNSFRLSAKDIRNNWIVPNTGYNSQTVSFSYDGKMNKWLKTSARATYLRKGSDNLPTTGYSQASPLYALMWNVVSEDSDAYKAEYFDGRIQWAHEMMGKTGQESYGQLIINNASGNARSENAYWLAYESLNSLDRDRVYGNVQAVADITNKISLLVRSGIDFTSDFRTSRKPQYSYNYAYGWYREQTTSSYEMNNDFLLSYNDEFEKIGLTLNASFGGNNMVSNQRYIRQTAEELQEPNIFMLSNSRSALTTTNTRTDKSVNSLYGLVSLGWKNMVYLDITGRNDWSSALADKNWSFFYPSVSASVLLDEIFNFRHKAKWINMLKVRASWANVGNDTKPYDILTMYANGSFPSSYHTPTTMPYKNIKPENVESWEFGLETRLLNNRISFDFAWYHSKTTNQIIPSPLDRLTGASSWIVNAGRVDNKGVELSARFQPVRTRNINWTINMNWSKNWNKLIELAPGVDVWQMNTSNTVGGRVLIYAYPGTELGRIYGYGFDTAPEGSYYMDGNGQMVDCSGQHLVNAVTGNPELDLENLKDLGSIYPDWQGGFSTSFSWKNLSFNATFTAQWGGRAYSVTNQALAVQGKTKSTLPGRYDGLIHEGVNLNSDGTYSKNKTITTDVVEYYNSYIWHNNNVEMNTFDTSFLKFKEARIDYSLPQNWMVKSKVFQDISIGFFVTNIFCWTNFPQYDPEVASMNNGSISRGIESGSYPMTRTYGLNLKLSF